MKSHPWGGCTACDLFPNWDSKLLSSGASQRWSSLDVGFGPIWWCICGYISLLFLFFCLFNDCVLKLSHNPLLNIEIVLCVCVCNE